MSSFEGLQILDIRGRPAKCPVETGKSVICEFQDGETLFMFLSQNLQKMQSLYYAYSQGAGAINGWYSGQEHWIKH